MNKLHLGIFVLLAVAACEGSVFSEATGGAGTGAGGSTGDTTTFTTPTTTTTTPTGSGGGITTTTTTLVGPCPSSPPAAGSPCASILLGQVCTYGDSVRPDCREEWTCEAGSWQVKKNTCTLPPPGECGNAAPAPGTTCPTMGDECVYGDAICYCGCPGGIFCGSTVTWQCSQPPSPPCPPVAPNSGAACNSEGTTCTYGDPCTPDGAIVQCTAGFWSWDTMIACGG